MLLPSRRIICYTLLASCYTMALSHLSFAKFFSGTESIGNTPATIEADQLGYDSTDQVVTASGNVQVIQGGRTLSAETLTYNQQTNRITANGNIRLYEPPNVTLTGDRAVLQRDLTEGSMEHVLLQFPDASHAKAEHAIRVNSSLTELYDASYTSCKSCQDTDGKEKSPLWEIHAQKTTFDETSESVRYKNARLEVYGVPVFYTPYFSHPTPNASSKSGFLIPKYQNSSVFGTSISTPYYIALAPNRDLLLTPTETSKLGPILEADYHHLFINGAMNFKGSITDPPRFDNNGHQINGHDVRGHLEGKGNFDISKQWSWGFKGNRSTDDTYLRKYHYSQEDTLTSTAYSTYLNDRNFAHIETVTFQELQQTDNPAQTPLVLPHLQGEWESTPGTYGDHFGMQADVLSLSRDTGTSSRHISSTGYWSIPYITSHGHVFEWKNSVRADGYSIDKGFDTENNKEFNGETGRLIPQTEVKWSYPLLSQHDNYRIVVAPITNLIASPYGGNSLRIPNEDSQDIEFSDINLFSDDHFTGMDRVEEGPRANYGIKANLDHDVYGYTNFVLGQTYQVKHNQFFDAGSGLGDNQSDIVGRASYSYFHDFDLAYQFRLDHNDLTANQNLIHGAFRYKPVTFSLDYLSSHETFDNITGTSPKRELMSATTKLQLTDQWSLAGTGNRDIEEGEWRSTRGDLIYDGNCVKFTWTLNREFTRDRDITPNTSVSFQVSLKNLTD